MTDESRPPELSARPVRRRLPLAARFALAVGALFVIGMGASVAGYFYWVSSLEAQLEARRAAERARGLPVTLAELDAWYPAVPDAENAALLYLEAMAALEATDTEHLRELFRTTREFARIADYPPAHAAALHDIAADMAPIRDLLAEASRKPASRFAIDLTRGYWSDTPDLVALRDLAAVQYLVAEAALLDGDTGAAVEHHAGLLSLGGALAEEPLLLSQMMGIAVHRIAFQGLERMLNHAPLDAGQLRTLDAAYAEARRPGSFQRAMAGERCIMAEMFRTHFGTGSDGEMYQSGIRSAVPLSIYARLEQIRVYDTFEPLTQAPPPDWPALLEYAASLPGDERLSLSLASKVMPDFQRSIRGFVRDTASQRIARAVLAVERYRLERGDLPESLADIVPVYLERVPEDPVDGAPLRYRVERGAYTVFSVYDEDADGGAASGARDGSARLAIAIDRRAADGGE